MSTNGRLDISTLVDWDGHQNYLLPEVARQWIALRNAYFILTGYWLYTSECYRPVGEEGDFANGRVNTQWYWFEYYGRDTRWAAYPGSNSSHGEAKAMDLIGWASRVLLIALARQYGFTFPFDWEDWHLQYTGNPTIIASLDTTPFGGVFMALTDQQQTDLYNGVMALTASEIVPGNPFSWSQAVLNEIRDNLLGDEASIKDAARREGRLWRLFRDTSKADTAPDAYVAIAYSLDPTDPRQVIYLDHRQATSLGSNYLMTADTPENAQRLSAEAIATAVQLARGTDPVYTTKAG